MNRIKLWNGNYVNLDDINSLTTEILPIGDLFIGLDRIKRFNGQHPLEISVLSHSYQVAKMMEENGYDPLRCLLGLLHDAPEIITGDISSPIKMRYLSDTTFDVFELSLFRRFFEMYVPFYEDRKYGNVYVDPVYVDPAYQLNTHVKPYDLKSCDFELELWRLWDAGEVSDYPFTVDYESAMEDYNRWISAL